MKFDIQMKFKFPLFLFATDWSYKDIRISNGKVSKKKFIRQFSVSIWNVDFNLFFLF